MSEAHANPSPLDKAAEPALLTPRLLAGGWLLLGAVAFIAVVQTQSSLDSLLTGVMVVCGVMVTQLLGAKAARVSWVALAVALLGLYGAQQQGWVAARTPDPLLGLSAGLVTLMLGVLQALAFNRARAQAAQLLLAHDARARRAAEEASRARLDFASTVSHEIRTPLNGILGLVTLLQDERLDRESRHQYLRMLEQSSLALSNWVSGMVALGSIREGRVELRHERFSIQQWAQDLENSFSASAAIKGLFLQMEVDASVGDDAIGDSARLRQIAANYLSNAIKFTKAGTIRVRISRPRGDELLRLEVRDSGIGLTDSAQQELFKPLQQRSNRVQHESVNAGLGLSICERWAQRMGGTVGVHSLPGVGSTFWAEVRVPSVMRGDPHAAPFPEPNVDWQAGAGPLRSFAVEGKPPSALDRLPAFDLDAARVLVVDDNAVNRTTTSQMLRRMNAIVATANDGQEGLDAMRTAHAEGWPFDLVLMDVQMPGMDGLTAVGLLRADPALQATPVVALTAGVLQEDVRRAIGAGMDGFLAKPVTADHLGRNVAHFADMGRQRRQAAQDLRF